MKAVFTDVVRRRACIASLFLIMSCLLYRKIILENYIKMPTHPLGEGVFALKHIKNENICNKTRGCVFKIHIFDRLKTKEWQNSDLVH